MISVVASAATPDETERETVARTLIQAMSIQDMPTCASLLATDPALLFGACPIMKVQELSEPYVRDDQAYITVTAEMTDPAWPTTTYLMLCKGDVRCGENNGKWMVRMLCRKSVMANTLRSMNNIQESESDAKAHTQVTEVATQYLQNWIDADYTGMESLWYNWTKRDRHGEKGVDMTVKSATAGETTAKEPTVTLLISVKAPGILSFIQKKYHMTLVFLKEPDGWKVRGSQMELY